MATPWTTGPIVLSMYPGVTTGALADNTARAGNTTAINAAMAAASVSGTGRGIVAGAETYEIYGPIIVPNRTKCVFNGILTLFKQYQDQVAVFHCGPPLGESSATASDILIDGGRLFHANNQAGLGTGGRVLELTNTWKCVFRNMMLGNFYDVFASAKFCNYGIYNDATGAVESFNNTYENIKIKWFDKVAIYLPECGTNCRVNDIYIQNGDNTNQASADRGIEASLGTGLRMDNINIEWAKLASAIYLNNVTATTIGVAHIEEIYLRNTSGTANRGLIELIGGSHCAMQAADFYNSRFINTNNVANCSYFMVWDGCYIDVQMFKTENSTKTGTTLYVVQSSENVTGQFSTHINIDNIRIVGTGLPDAFDNLTLSASSSTRFKYQRLGPFRNAREELVSMADAAATIYAFTHPQEVTMTPSVARVLTLSKQNSSGSAMTIPPGPVFWVTCATGSAGSITVNNHDAALLKSLTAGTWGKFQFDGTNWVNRGTGAL